MKAITDAEVKYYKKLGLAKPPDAPAVSTSAAPDEKKTLDYHLNAIDALGWEIMGLKRRA